jgi:hypothetical protein
LSRTEIPPLDEFAIEIDFMEKPRELFETELAEIRNELLRLRVRPSESLQQSSATHKELLSAPESQCAGTLNAISGVIDWKFAPKWDVYVGRHALTNTEITRPRKGDEGGAQR